MKVRELVFCGLFAALTAVLAQVVLPLPFSPVSVNLALIAPLMAGSLLGGRSGAVSQLLYLILGFIGLPVFTAFRGGPGVLFGPGGGYLIGYMLAAVVSGQKKHQYRGFLTNCMIMIAGVIACYLCGTVWFMAVSGNNLFRSLSLCVLPFLPGDVFKIALSSYLVKKLWPIFKK